MTAIIEVVTPRGTVRELQVRSDVTVVGSSTDADLRVDGSDERLVTIEFRRGGYFVHNRSERRLRLRGRMLRPRAVRKWKSGDTLRIDENCELVLWSDSAPPVTTPILGPPLGMHYTAVTRPTRQFRPSASVVVATALIIIVCAWSMMRTSSRPANMSQFEAVLQMWRAPADTVSGTVNDTLAKLVVVRLQEAREYELARNQAAMHRSYSRLKNFLIGRKNTESGARDKQIDATLQFIYERLST